MKIINSTLLILLSVIMPILLTCFPFYIDFIPVVSPVFELSTLLGITNIAISSYFLIRILKGFTLNQFSKKPKLSGAMILWIAGFNVTIFGIFLITIFQNPFFLITLPILPPCLGLIGCIIGLIIGSMYKYHLKKNNN